MSGIIFWILLAIYVFAAGVLLLFALNCYVMLALFLRRKGRVVAEEENYLREFYATPGRDILPVVTTQIPLYNEYNVALRVIRAAAEMEYPSGRHEIQVLDDSDDETRERVDGEVSRLQAQGVEIKVLRRENRVGFKAGALAEGFESARGEFIAIFDADFVPPKDFLLRTVPLFLRDAKLGLVQARWGHLNASSSLLTACQAVGIDGHFLVEQPARSWNGLYMNFNGTAGIWRGQAIHEAGGWESDTLTEDMDLSYRMQLEGWKAYYTLSTVVPSEIPENILAFKSQQFRWAKGSIQTALKLLPRVMAGRASCFVKLQAILHMTHYSIHPMMLCLAVLGLPLLLLMPTSFPGGLFLALAPLFLVSLMAPSVLYAGAQIACYPDWKKRIASIPFLVGVGVGLAVNNSLAVLEALLGKKTPFIRTPKRGDQNDKPYQLRISPLGAVEILLGLYCAVSMGVYFQAQRYIVGPFLAVYAIGFLFTGTLSLVHGAGYGMQPRTRHFTGALPSGRLWWAGGASVFLLLLFAMIGQLGSIGPHLASFFTLYTLAFAGGLILLVALPSQMSRRQMAVWIFGLAVACRLALFPLMMSDDVNRYVWEGRMVAHGINPYVVSPSDPSLSSYRDALWSAINHPEMTAAYPPGILLLFSLVVRFFESAMAFKVVMVLFDLGTIILLMRLLEFKDRNPRWALLYALNPLVLVSFAGQAHLDSVMIFFMVAALLAFERRHWTGMFALLGLAVQAKYMAILLLPFLLTRQNLRHIWSFFLIVLSLYLPFSEGGWKLFSSLSTYATTMAHNGPVHHWLRLGLGSMTWATALCTAIFGVACGALLWKRPKPLLAGKMVFLALILFSPSVHFWYLAWIIPFLCFSPCWSCMILCWTSGFYFVSDHMRLTTGVWNQPLLFHILQWGPVFPFFLWEAWSAYRRSSFPPAFSPAETFSVVIPTLNEGTRLENCIRSLRAMTQQPMEIIVVDGGSTDKTVEIAQERGVTIFHALRGRGNQMHRGLVEAKGDVTMFVHADTLVTSDVASRVLDSLRKSPDVAGGAVGQRFDSSNISLSIVEILNDFKAAMLGISFGDQIQFVRTEFARRHHLVAQIPLMEDVEFSLRLRRIGKATYLWGGAIVSARKWHAQSFIRLLQIIRLVTLFLFRRLYGRLHTHDLYRSYYPGHGVLADGLRAAEGARTPLDMNASSIH